MPLVEYANPSGSAESQTAVSAANPLPVTGSITASNPSVGAVNATAPTSATLVGLEDANGNLQPASATNPLPVALAASDFVFSTLNSSTAQLASNATFTGTIEDIRNQPDISILLTSDQNGTLTVLSYIDAAGARTAATWTFPIVAGTPFDRSFIVNANYVKLTFQNTGGSTTTTFNLNTAYGNLGPADALGNESVGISSINGATVLTGGVAGSMAVGGTAASGAAISGNPLLQGGRAQSAEPTAVTNGQAIAEAVDLTGKTINSPYANRENMVRGSASATGTGATTVIAAQGASVKTYITGIQLSNTSATTVYVTLSDAAATILIVPAGGGNNVQFPVPLATAANIAFTFTVSGSASTIYCSAQGFTGY